MNKRIKSIIATVTVLVLGAFSLYAEEVNVNESKLTNLSYVKKTYKTKYKYVCEDGFYYYSSDRKAAFLKFKGSGTKKGTFAKIGIVNVDDEVYGRIVIHSHDTTFACNLHDTEYSVKGKLAAYLSKDDVEDLAKEFKDTIIEIALDLDLKEEPKEKN